MPYGLPTASSGILPEIVSIPHMGCMPYGHWCGADLRNANLGFNPSYGLHALRAAGRHDASLASWCFNPSYGLHALRAGRVQEAAALDEKVSIPHMGCMPYGLGCRAGSGGMAAVLAVSIPHMGCMPYGPPTTAA